MEGSSKRIIEINGVKLEVDLRHAKRLDTFRVGDRVKLLKKNYDSYTVHTGIIASFDEFVQRPSIVVAYISDGYSDAGLKFATINKDSKDYEICPAYEADVEFSKADILSQMDMAIEKARASMRDLEEKRRYFLANFGRFFSDEPKGE